MNLKSKVAIVTGASSGIGAEFCKMLVASGAIVYGLARSGDKLQSLQKKFGGNFRPVIVDITQPEEVERWVEATFHVEHVPDILINNAGVAYFSNVDELKISEWEAMIQVNLSGIFYLTRLIVPFMKENENVCHIINIASIAGLLGNPTMSGYNASKYGVRGFSEALFKELRYDGIKVSCVLPGSIATGFFTDIDEEKDYPHMMAPNEVAETVKFLLETSDNFLINEITMRPLNPKK